MHLHQLVSNATAHAVSQRTVLGPKARKTLTKDLPLGSLRRYCPTHGHTRETSNHFVLRTLGRPSHQLRVRFHVSAEFPLQLLLRDILRDPELTLALVPQ